LFEGLGNILKKFNSITFAFILLLGANFVIMINETELVSAGSVINVGSGAGNDTNSIQDAIDNFANSGDTVFVYKGTYNENLVIDKTINLTGEDKNETIVNGQAADAIYVTANWINITGFTVTNGNYGIWVDSSSNNSIINNIVTSNSNDGIYLTSSPYNTISGNNISNNDYGLHIRVSSNHTIVNSNEVFNNSINGIYLSKLSYVQVNDNIITSNGGNGIFLFTAENSSISNNMISDNNYGIYLTSSSKNNIMNVNEIVDNNNGIHFGLASNNTVSENNVYLNQNHGIRLHSSSKNNTVLNNNISVNGGNGIYLTLSSDYNLITNNTVDNNLGGINLSSSSNNTILENEFNANSNGFYLSNSLDNIIHHNNIKNNTNQAFDDTNDGNFWDDGYPSGGNYWSDWLSPDINNGPNQDIPGSDGIVDGPYIIDADSEDGYPLTNPLDKVPPIITGLTPPSNFWTNIKLPLISANFIDDSQIDTASIILTINGINVTSQADIYPDKVEYLPSSSLSDGTYNIYIEVRDILGNLACTSWTFYIETQPPRSSSAEINGQSSIIVANGTSVTLTAIIDDSGTGGSKIAGANYTIGSMIWPGIPLNPQDGAFNSFLENVEVTIDTTDWLDGSYDLYVYCWDEIPNYNLSSTAFAQIIIDSIPPSSSIDPVLEYWFRTSSISLNALASDLTSNVEDVELWYRHSNDNLTWSPWILFETDSMFPWNWNFNFPMENGFYEFYSVATDTPSNSEFKISADLMCGYDDTSPLAEAGPDKEVIIGEIIDFDGSNSTDNILIINYTWTIEDDGIRIIYGKSPSYLFEDTGSYQVTLTVTDSAGNIDTDTIQVNVNETLILGSISGVVTDEGGNPLNRTWVKVGVSPNYLVNWTNEMGYYLHDDLPLGNYTILVRKRGYKIPDPIDFAITENQSDIHIDFKLKEFEEEEPEICLSVYFITTVILIIIFILLYMKIRKIKPEKPQEPEPTENLDASIDNQNIEGKLAP
jgi:parallel beta-helix repeat protein